MNAVKKTFKDKRIERISFDNDASDYYYLELDGKNRKIRVIIAQQREMGMAAATNLTQSIIYHFKPFLNFQWQPTFEVPDCSEIFRQRCQ